MAKFSHLYGRHWIEKFKDPGPGTRGNPTLLGILYTSLYSILVLGTSAGRYTFFLCHVMAKFIHDMNIYHDIVYLIAYKLLYLVLRLNLGYLCHHYLLQL